MPANIQIGLDGAFARANLIGLVRFEAVQRQAIFLRIDRHGAQTQFVRRAKNAYGDFAAVRREQFLIGCNFVGRGLIRGAHSYSAQKHARIYIVSRTERETSAFFSMESSRFLLAGRRGCVR